MPKKLITKSDILREFEKRFGKAPEGTPVIKTIDGRKTCFWCGHPVSPDKELNNVKSFISQKIDELLGQLKEGGYIIGKQEGGAFKEDGEIIEEIKKCQKK